MFHYVQLKFREALQRFLSMNEIKILKKSPDNETVKPVANLSYSYAYVYAILYQIYALILIIR